MSLKKVGTGLIKNIRILTSDNESSDRKKQIAKNMLKSTPWLTAGYFLKNVNNEHIEKIKSLSNKIEASATPFSVDNMSPMEAVVNGIQMGQANNASEVLFMIGTFYLFKDVGSLYDSKNKNSLIRYGADYCPYDSYIDYKNNYKAKMIQQRINNVELLAHNYRKGGLTRKSILFLKDSFETVYKYGSKMGRTILDFAGYPEYGWLSLTHNNPKYNNPKLINQLTIPKSLKSEIRQDLMDENCEMRLENREFVKNVMLKSQQNIREEIEDRNINLSLVRLIDELLMEGKIEVNKKEQAKKIKLMHGLKKNFNTRSDSRYDSFDKVFNYIFFEKGLKNINIKHYNTEDDKFERAYHIFRELDKICYEELKCEPLKKPLTYREINSNEIIMAVQNQLRGDHAEHAKTNRGVQNRSFLIKDHYVDNPAIKERLSEERSDRYENDSYLLICRKNFVLPNYNGANKNKKRKRKKVA